MLTATRAVVSIEWKRSLNWPGPTDLQSIGVAYKGKILPFDLEDLTSLVVTCRQRGKRFIQPDYYQIFLDPTAWAGSLRRSRSWKSSEDRRRRGMNNGSYEKLLTKTQADEVFSFTKSQWEARAAGSNFVPIDWHIRFSRHDTGLQIIGYEPLTRFGFSVQPLYANDTDPPIMVIIRNYFLPGKLPPMTLQLQKRIEAVAQRSLGPTYKVKLECGRIENFDSLEFTLTKP